MVIRAVVLPVSVLVVRVKVLLLALTVYQDLLMHASTTTMLNELWGLADAFVVEDDGEVGGGAGASAGRVDEQQLRPDGRHVALST